MGLYHKQIEQLVALQKVDDAIHSITSSLENAPKEVAILQQRFDILDAQRKHILDKLEHIREQEKRIANEIEDDSLRIKKSKTKLMQVENQKEYHAVMREMDSMEKLNRSRAEEKLALAEELELQNEALAEMDERYNALKDELDAKASTLDEQAAKAQLSLDELNAKRAEAGSEVPAPVLSRYEFIRKRLAHPVIVSVEAGICSGCHIAIPPQSFIELQKSQQILSCPNCQRLIYWCEHFCAEPETAVVEELD